LAPAGRHDQTAHYAQLHGITPLTQRELELLELVALVQVVGEATDGREAVHLVETYEPDVVLMDAQMPVMDGLEASRRIKLQYPQARIIMLTVYNARRTEAAAAGVDVFLSKGCPVETLLSAILMGK
jgi:DNA-binding NarL/FixJ family response regulator